MIAPKNWIADKLKAEFGESYGAALWRDQQEIISLYSYYDGQGQDWPTPSNLDYVPTKIIANKTKHLIKEEARFMLSRPPEISIIPAQGSTEDNVHMCAEMEQWLRQLLEDCGWASRLSKAGRDIFVGKRLSMKLIGGQGKPLGVRLLPALEFAFDLDCETGRITKILYYYHKTHDTDPKRQRTWVQRYWLEGGACWMEQGVYDGYGVLQQDEELIPPTATGLDFVPSTVIINDGLTGEITGESDVAVLKDLADAYNRRLSDDQDALKFNMFPQRVFRDVEPKCLENIKVSPGSLLDIQSSVTGEHQATAEIMESGFGYDARYEHSVDRLDKIMHEQLSIPMTTIDQLKSLGISGKALKMLYNPLIARCEEKWQAWDEAIRWMVRSLAAMARLSGGPDYTGLDYTVAIDHLWPIPNDDDAEREQDRLDVAAQTMSRKAYIDKWRPTADAEEELRQMALERQQLEESSYM